MKALLTLLFVFSCLLLTAQSRINGKIFDEEKTPLPFAHIFNLSNSEIGISGINGYFELPAMSTDTLRISFVGYKTLIVIVNDDMMERSISATLSPDYIELPSVWVFANQKYNVPKRYIGKPMKIPGITETDPNYESPKPGSIRLSDHGGDEFVTNGGLGLTLYGPFSFFSADEKEKRAASAALLNSKQTISYSRTMALEQTRELLMHRFNLNRAELDILIVKINLAYPEIQHITQEEKIVELVSMYISEQQKQ